MDLHSQSCLLFTAALAFLTVTSGVEWGFCSGELSAVQTIKDVTLVPDPVPAGSSALFTLTGTSKVSANDTLLNLSVYYLGVRVYHHPYKNPWPVRKGDLSGSLSRNFPKLTPPGSYTVKLESLTSDGQLLTCVEIKFKVKWSLWTQDGAENVERRITRSLISLAV